MHRYRVGMLAAGLLFVTTTGARAVVGSDWGVDGDQAGAGFGGEVAVVGDVDGDGYSDVVVGAPLWGSILWPDSGRAFLYLGSNAGLSTVANWSVGSGQAGAHLGSAIAAAGDVNGDGYDDVLIAAPDYTNGEAKEGRVQLYLGSPAGLPDAPSWTAEGGQSYCAFGLAVAGLGDVNGDGFDDVAIGAPRYNNPDPSEGVVFVYYGSAAGLPAAPSTTREGDFDTASFGVSLASAGDVNADGLDDMIVGAYTWGTNAEGGAFVYLGTTSGLAQDPVWIAESNQDYAYFGVSVAGVGDVNADGYGDVLVGSFLYDHAYEDEGAAFLYYGNAAGVSSTPALSVYSNHGHASFGRSVAPAGDMNGDGYADIVIGAPYYSMAHSQEGVIGIYFGSEDGIYPAADLIYWGGQDTTFFGESVSSAGDVNGDGYGDVIAGAVWYDDGDSNEGKAFAFHGGPEILAGQANWSISGLQADADWGEALTFGDFNGDGFSDLVSGSEDYDGVQIGVGHVGVSYGEPGGSDGGFDWQQEGQMSSRGFGRAVAAADLNGDGYDELAIGVNNGGIGQVQVYAGSATGLANEPSAVLEGAVWFGHAIANAGDVDGDGFLDLLVGDAGHLVFRGQAQLFRGSADGVETTAFWTFVGSDAQRGLGYALAGGGDINADGYSDFLVSGPLSDHGEVLAFHGGPDGPGDSPMWTHVGVCGSVGRALAFCDVNGDGYSDALIGTPDHPGAGGNKEGRVDLYRGSAISLTGVSWARHGGMAEAQLGWSVAAADFNNDGLSDVVLAAPGYTAGEDHEGKAYVYLAPLDDTPAWTLQGDQEEARLGNGLAAGGDTDGDGYPDLTISSPSMTSGLFNVGKVQLFRGNEGGGVMRGIRQRRADGSAPIALLSGSGSDEVQLAMAARSPFGRDGVRVEYQIAPVGSTFDGSPIVQSEWIDTGAPVSGMGSVTDWTDLVTGLVSGEAYHWRARIASRSPWFPASPWFSPSGNAASEWDVRAGDPSTSDTPEAPATPDTLAPSGVSLALASQNPFTDRVGLRFTLAESAPVRLVIYDVAGREVSPLVEVLESAGAHTVQWDGRGADGRGSQANVPAGVYFARLEVGKITRTVRLVRAQ